MVANIGLTIAFTPNSSVAFQVSLSPLAAGCHLCFPSEMLFFG